MAKKKKITIADLNSDNNEPQVNETPIIEITPVKKEAVKEKKKVFAYCCIHGGILFNLSTGKLFLPSANEVSVKNQFLNVTLNPNKYSVTEITEEQMEEIKKKYGTAKYFTNKFVFFSKESTLPKSIEAEMLKIRGKSPWEQMSDEDIERFGVKKKTED
jgi:hypothetical protein